jgi:fructokinase
MLMEWLDEAAWVKLNEEELQHLTPNGKGDLQDAEALLARYTLQGLILTHGAKGAYLFDPDKAPIKVSPASKQAVVDTVGAGDAFTSVILLGLLQHWPMQSTLERAQSFASHMVGVRGATLQDKAVYERFAEKWRTSEG